MLPRSCRASMNAVKQRVIGDETRTASRPMVGRKQLETSYSSVCFIQVQQMFCAGMEQRDGRTWRRDLAVKWKLRSLCFLSLPAHIQATKAFPLFPHRIGSSIMNPSLPPTWWNLWHMSKYINSGFNPRYLRHHRRSFMPPHTPNTSLKCCIVALRSSARAILFLPFVVFGLRRLRPSFLSPNHAFNPSA